MGPALSDPTSTAGIFSSVESRKNAFLGTASQCTKAGITFGPLILEAVGGGWSDAVRSVVAWIASESKRSGPIDGSDASFKIAQRISCALHRENARAILKRATEQLGVPIVGLSVCLSWPSRNRRNSSVVVGFLVLGRVVWGGGGGVLPLSPGTTGNCVTVRLFAYPLICTSAHAVVLLSLLLAVFPPSLRCTSSVTLPRDGLWKVEL